MPDERVLVLRQGTHGMPIEEYVGAVRRRLPDHQVDLARTQAAEHELLPEATVVTSLDFDEALLDRAENLRLFAAISAGYGHLPLEAFADRGVTVTNASGVHGPNMAEQVMGHILAFARRIREGWRRQQRRQWRHYQAGELKGSTVTVVGLGAIGQALVERLDGFGVETIGVRYTPSKGGPTDRVVGFDEIDEALAETDYLVLACPLTETTEGLIGEAEFLTLPPSAVLVNVARGPVVDTDALVDAIRGNEIDGAALDVTDPEPLPEDHTLWGFDNVTITPHMAGHTPEYYERCADILAENVEQIEETGSYTGVRNQVVPGE